MSQTRRALLVGAALVLGGASLARAQEGFLAIWGSGPNDVWAVGGGRAALHFDGRAWAELPYGVPVSGGFTAVWGSGPNSVFVGGESGTILRWNGQAWSRMAVPTDRAIVALAGRSAADVYALAQSYSDTEAPTLLHWNGRAWTPTPLPLPFRANALALSGTGVLVAGWVMNDPTPGERRTYGVLARRVAARWVLTGGNGRAVTDRVVAGAGWSAVGVSGTAVLLAGERDDGERSLAISRGAAFTPLPAVPASGGQLSSAFLASDGVPVAFLSGVGLARYTGRGWGVAGPGSETGAQQMQQLGMDPTAQGQMAVALRYAAWGDIGNTRAAWGSSGDFYAVTEGGRVIRVQGSDARIAYDASCANPQMAMMNPICQALQQTGAGQPQAPRTALPMPSIRVKRP